MKKTLFIIVTILYSTVVFSQNANRNNRTTSNPNSIQLDIAGRGLKYSLNYERILLTRSSFHTSGRIGFSTEQATLESRINWIPIEVIEFYSLENHHIELGLGCIISKESNLNSEIDWTLFRRFTGKIGYRYQKTDGRFLFKVGLSPYYNTLPNANVGYGLTNGTFHLSGGVSVGLCF